MAGTLLGSLLKTRTRRVVVPLVAAAVVGTAGVAGAVALSHNDGTFVVTAVSAPPVLPGGSVSQAVAGLWAGPQVSSWTKVDGPSWLTVDDEGAVVGTAPATAPAEPAVVTVQADGDAESTIEVVVRVVAPSQPQRLEAASWNLDGASNDSASGAVTKRLKALVAEGVQVAGLQETGATAAKELATGLGWYYWQSAQDQAGGDLGLVSAYPITQVTTPTATVPAAAATVDVNGQHVRVWVAHLDEADPARATEATAVAAAMADDLAAAAGATGTPVVLLGDLAAAAPQAPFAALADTYRVAYPDAAAHPGATWHGERVDYVLAAGPLQTLAAESYATAGSSWPSDHHAAIAVLGFTASHPATAATAGTPPLGTGAHQAEASPQPAAEGPRTLALISPRITGTAKVGRTLRVRTVTGSPKPRLTFQWYAGKKAIKHATKAHFRVTRAQRGKRISVKVTGTLTGYHATSSSSAATKRVR